MKTRVIIEIDGKQYVHSFGIYRDENSVRAWFNETMSPGTKLIKIEHY